MDGDDLLLAASTGDTTRIHQLVDAGVDVNFVHTQGGNSALHNATYSNQLAAINALLERGADPNLALNYRSIVDGREESGVVALMYALSADAAIALINCGANVNATDERGITPLIRAADRAKEDIVKVLLEAGADPKIKMKDGRTAEDVARAAIDRYESWVVGVNRTPIASKVERLQRICRLLAEA